MRWQTGTTHTSKIAPNVTVERPPNPAYPVEVKIDFRGLGVYLSTEEAHGLAKALSAAVENTR